jgi:hypothetical protein
MLYLCRWPNGDLSIVSGSNLTEIDDVLDEVGDGHSAELTRITGRFAVHFRLKEKASQDAQGIEELLELQGFDETSWDRRPESRPHWRPSGTGRWSPKNRQFSTATAALAV